MENIIHNLGVCCWCGFVLWQLQYFIRGYVASDQVVTGSGNTIVGYLSGYKLKTGGYNVFVGQESGYENDDGQANYWRWFGALYYNRANEAAVGYRSQYYTDSTDSEVWNYNTSLGAYALEGSNSPGSNTGEYNTAVGSCIESIYNWQS